MCQRFRLMIEEYLRWTWPQAARELNYTTTAMLYEVRAGKQFPDVVRLLTLAQKFAPDGRVPNLDWILAGRGQPLLNVNDAGLSERLMREISHLSPAKQRAIQELIKQMS